MYRLDVSDRLKRIFRKLLKKDRKRYEIAMSKMQEIVGNPHRYKSLRYDMKEFSRVHIDSHFVLIFRIDEANKAVKFEDLDHHYNIYRR